MEDDKIVSTALMSTLFVISAVSSIILGLSYYGFTWEAFIRILITFTISFFASLICTVCVIEIFKK